MTDPLVYLPFEPARLGEVPDGLSYEVFKATPGEALPESVRDVEFYVPAYRFDGYDSEVIAEMPSIKVVQTMTAGVEHVRPYVPEGVRLCNGRGIHDASTAEMTLTLILASLRGIPQFVRAQDNATWAPTGRPALADKRVLIVGYGQIGAAIEARLLPFEVEVVRVARRAKEGIHPIDQLPDLLPYADVVVLIVPGTAATTGLVDATFLSRMKDGALLVNMARGPVVRTDALVEALHTGRIQAAIDVVDPEPLPSDHPLWQAPNLLIAPHVGGATSAMWPRAYRLIREQLKRYAAGEPLVNVMTGDY
jgi:phosphoglycerate dehydrogenase-like enzyme